VEVAHEALIRSWPQLRKWIDADRAGLRTRTRLTEAARDWTNAGRNPAYLYTGARLAVAKEWEASHSGELSADEAEFLRCSHDVQQQREASELEAAQRLARAEAERAQQAEKARQLEEERAQEAEKRAREQERAARAEAERAEEAEKREQEQKEFTEKLRVERAAAEQQARIAESRRLSAESSSMLRDLPQRSLLLAVEANKVEQPFHGAAMAAAEQSLRGRPIARADEPITAVAISPDNRWLVTGSKDKTARLWDLRAQDPASGGGNIGARSLGRSAGA
jgi:WD domain, G-beta repeat